VPWDLIREMLDEEQQMYNFRVRRPDGQGDFDEAAARANIISTLQAVASWHEKNPKYQKLILRDVPPDLRAVYVLVDKLAKSPIMEMKSQAEKARKKCKGLPIDS